MPQIPTYTAQTSAQPAQYTQHAGSGIISGDEGISAGFNRLAAGVKSITDKIQKQNEDLNVSELLGQYNSGIKDIQQNLPSTINDPLKWQEEFDKQEGQLRKGLESQTFNGNALVRFRTHTNQIAPLESIRVKHDAQNVTIQQQTSRMLDVGATQAKIAAEAQTPEEHAAAVSVFTNPNATNPDERGILEKSRAKGYITPLQEQKIRTEFIKDVAKKNMDFLSRENPDQMFKNLDKGMYANVDVIDREKIVESVGIRQKRIDDLNSTAFNRTAQEYENSLFFMAGTGSIPESKMSDILAGKDPWFRNYQRAAELKKVNDTAPNGEGTKQVKALQQEYHLELGIPTVERVNRYQKRLQELSGQVGRQNPEADKFGKELQSELQQMQGLDYARINAGIKAFKDNYEAENPRPPMDIMNLQKNKKIQDEAEASSRIRKGEDPDKVRKDISERNRKLHDESLKKLSPQDDAAQKYLKGKTR